MGEGKRGEGDSKERQEGPQNLALGWGNKRLALDSWALTFTACQALAWNPNPCRTTRVSC